MSAWWAAMDRLVSWESSASWLNGKVGVVSVRVVALSFVEGRGTISHH